ncbi:MAG: hypothetical protein R6U36_09085 [Candidatus Fermentibacteraceae bacterium]
MDCLRALRWPAALLALAALAALAQLPALGSFFDPQDFITFLIPLEEGHSFHSYMVEGWSWDVQGERVGFLRPLTSLTYMLEYPVWGPRPVAYRAAGLLLHAVTCLLLGHLLGRAREDGPRWPAAVLFALHPGAVGAVWMANARGDLLAALLTLAAMAAVVRLLRRGFTPARALLPGALALLALAAKESGLAALLVLPATWLLWPDGRRDWRGGAVLAASLAAAAAVFLAARLMVFDRGIGGYGAVNPPEVMLARVPVLAYQSLGALFPAGWMRAAAVVSGLAAAVWLFLRNRRTARIALLLILCWGAMGFQTLTASPDMRYLYAPSAAVALLAAIFLCEALRRPGGWALTGATLLLGLAWMGMSRQVAQELQRRNAPMQAVYAETRANLELLEGRRKVAVVVSPDEVDTPGASMKEIRLYLDYLSRQPLPEIVYVPSPRAAGTDSAEVVVHWAEGGLVTGPPLDR